MVDFAQCFLIPQLWSLALAAGFFLLAYILYSVLLFALRRMKRRNRALAPFHEELRYPLLFLFLELAAISSVQILTFPDAIESGLEHALNVVIIATIGWFIAGILRASYRYYSKKNGAGQALDLHHRATLTQVLLLYRISIFLICAVTIAAILLTFPYIKSIGVGILGSAGIAGIALGIAARPILLNLMAGIQIALSKVINIGDAVYVEGELTRIEEIHLTRVTARTWDLRRLVIPISYFIDKPFQNWDLASSSLLASVFLRCDYSVPIDQIKEKVAELVKNHPCWSGETWAVHVTDCDAQSIQLRISASVNDAAASTELRNFLREKLIDFLQKEYPTALPQVRTRSLTL